MSPPPLTREQLMAELAAAGAARDRYASLFDLAPIAYFTFDPTGVVLEVNHAGALLVGRSRDEILGLPFLGLVQTSEPGAFLTLLERSAAGEPRAACDLRLQSAAGHVDVHAVGTPLPDPGGSVARIATTFTDVSDRNRRESERREALEAEQRLRAQFESLDRAEIAIGQALAMLSTSGLQALLQVIADQARELTRAEYSAVGLVALEPERGFDPWVYSGATPEHAAAIGRSPQAVGVLAAVMLEARTIRVRELTEHPAFLGFPPNHPRMGSFLGVPIRFGDRVLGHLYLTNKRGAQEFSALDVRGAELMAEHVGVILEIARLHELEARDRERLGLLARAGDAVAATLDREVLGEQMARLAVPWFADFCMVGLLDAGRLKGVSFAHADPASAAKLREIFAGFTLGRDGPGIFARAWRTGQPELHAGPLRTGDVLPHPGQLKDTPELAPRSVLVVPMITRGEILGLIGFVLGDSGRRYEPRDIPIAEEIARRCVMALENATLFEDVRDAVQARDRQLIAAQEAIAARDGVLRIVAHDLRSPLAGIRMLADSLLRQGPERRTERALGMLHRTVDRMDRLIQDLLDVVRLDGGSLAVQCAPVNVRSILTEVVESHRLAAADAGLQISGELYGEPEEVHADRPRLLQALDNVVVNAIKFSEAEGGVTIEARQNSAGEVVFSVRDSGVGIPAEHISHLFERFWQGSGSDRRGAGLGLSIVKGIMDAHHGRVWVESAVGAGSTFYLAIPTVSAAACQDEAGAASAPPVAVAQR